MMLLAHLEGKKDLDIIHDSVQMIKVRSFSHDSANSSAGRNVERYI